MCTQKEILRDNILTGMQPFLSTAMMEILNQVVVQALFGLEVTESETLPATIDDTNHRSRSRQRTHSRKWKIFRRTSRIVG